MNKVCHEVAIEYRDWSTLCIESPPIGSRQIDQVLQQDLFRNRMILLYLKKLEVCRPGNALVTVGLSA